ncbi:MAG: S8 family serine peptidase, partial [Gemmatimonadota bacterium]
AGPEDPDPDPGPEPWLAKVDGPLVAKLEGEAPVAVLILSPTQPMLGPDGLEEFIEANGGRPRPELRQEMLRLLRETAEREQADLLSALDGRSRYLTSLWLVNGVAGVLHPDVVREVAAREDVRYVLEADVALAGFVDAGTVTEVVTHDGARFRRSGRPVAWYLDELHVPEVWEELDVTGEGVVIALLDSGIEYRHSDIRNRVWTNSGEVPNNGQDDDGNGLVDDYYGMDMAGGRAEVLPVNLHGAYVSGILVGDGTAGTVTGVAPSARVMTLKAGATVPSLRALEYALSMGADVANMSFSIPDLGNLRAVWRLAADHAVAAGLVLVSGAGNFAQTRPVPVQLRTPEDIPSVIAAGGVDRSRARAPFSSGGPVEWTSVRYYRDHGLPMGLTKPDVAAFPGPGYTVLDPSGGYVPPSSAPAGNSFSGPQAAGVAALVLSAAPELPAWEVVEVLESTAIDLGSAGKDNETGAGLLDARAAVEEALRRGG